MAPFSSFHIFIKDFQGLDLLRWKVRYCIIFLLTYHILCIKCISHDFKRAGIAPFEPRQHSFNSQKSAWFSARFFLLAT